MLPVRGVARQLVLKLGAALAELDWRRVVGEANRLAALALLAVLLDDEDGGRVEAHWRVDDVAGDVVAVGGVHVVQVAALLFHLEAHGLSQREQGGSRARGVRSNDGRGLEAFDWGGSRARSQRRPTAVRRAQRPWCDSVGGRRRRPCRRWPPWRERRPSGTDRASSACVKTRDSNARLVAIGEPPQTRAVDAGARANRRPTFELRPSALTSQSSTG